jgi:hypothetical protein
VSTLCWKRSTNVWIFSKGLVEEAHPMSTRSLRSLALSR